MDFRPAPEAAALRAEIRSVLAESWPVGRLGYRAREDELDYPAARAFWLRLAQHGWFGYGIPEEYGGRGGTMEQRYAVVAELAYQGVVYPKAAVNMIGPTILAHGSEQMKQRFLPRIARGELEFCLGYSEPDAGSDLAALRTTAERRGDRYVINGQKLYTSFAHRSDYCVLACRTDREAERHRGISLLLVDISSPGITIEPLWGMGGVRSNVTYWDDVEVPIDNRVGDENHGWRYVRTALSFERLAAFTVEHLRAVFDDLIDALMNLEPDGIPLSQRDAVRRAVAEIRADMYALEAITYRNLASLSSGSDVGAESSQLKVLATELRQRLVHLALELLGPEARLTDDGGPATGALYRVCAGVSMQIFGAGANEIQRDIIASQALQLPRGAD